MFAMRRRLRRITWVALTAMLALAFVPTLSHAVRIAGGVPSALSQVCTPQGARSATTSDRAPDSAPGALGHLDACAFCSLHADTLGLPQAQWYINPTSPGEAAPPPLRAAPRPLVARGRAQPRAPPALS